MKYLLKIVWGQIFNSVSVYFLLYIYVVSTILHSKIYRSKFWSIKHFCNNGVKENTNSLRSVDAESVGRSMSFSTKSTPNLQYRLKTAFVYLILYLKKATCLHKIAIDHLRKSTMDNTKLCIFVFKICVIAFHAQISIDLTTYPVRYLVIPVSMPVAISSKLLFFLHYFCIYLHFSASLHCFYYTLFRKSMRFSVYRVMR